MKNDISLSSLNRAAV